MVKADEHTQARIQAQIVKAQEAFATNLVDAFNTIVTRCAQTEGNALSSLTLAQMEELMDCLFETLTNPPPEGAVPFLPEVPEDKEPV